MKEYLLLLLLLTTKIAFGVEIDSTLYSITSPENAPIYKMYNEHRPSWL
jgi:hypothetical protein